MTAASASADPCCAGATVSGEVDDRVRASSSCQHHHHHHHASDSTVAWTSSNHDHSVGSGTRATPWMRGTCKLWAVTLTVLLSLCCVIQATQGINVTSATPGDGWFAVGWQAESQQAEPVAWLRATCNVSGVTPGIQQDTQIAGSSPAFFAFPNGARCAATATAWKAGKDPVWDGPTVFASPGAPLAPKDVFVHPGNTTISVRWQASQPTVAAAPVTSYTAVAISDTGQQGGHCDIAAPAVSCVIEHLDNNAVYQVYVEATNIFGPSPRTVVREHISPSGM